MHRHRHTLTLILVVTLAGGTLARVPGAQAAEACFAETGFCIQGRFLDYWTANGGLARNGYPLSTERSELLEDGKQYTVQYFERVRMELHPENAQPYDVLLGQFGRRVLNGRELTAATSPLNERATPIPGQAYFSETGHNLGGRFLAYWQANGGLAQFGYPLTEELTGAFYDPQTLTSTVQYFERARLELHPENLVPYDVLLGQFGRQILVENALVAEQFRAVYISNGDVLGTIGAPVGQAEELQGVTQAFEGGRMFYTAATARPDLIPVPLGAPNAAGRIVAFCGDQSGTWFPTTDTWQEGQPAGGGPAPTPDRFYPQRGFGKFWREKDDVRQCLGYARTPNEQATALLLQRFTRGVMFRSSESSAVYVLAYSTWSNGGFAGDRGRYQTYYR